MNTILGSIYPNILQEYINHGTIIIIIAATQTLADTMISDKTTKAGRPYSFCEVIDK